MITSSIVFVLSGLFVSYMFFTRRDALEAYDGMSLDAADERAVREQSVLLSTSICSTNLDIRLRNAYQRTLTQLRAVDAEYLRNKMHDLAAFSEKKALAVLSKFLNRFGKVRDVVTGKDLPKNKGSVSFFLKHIEHHKNHMEGYMQDESQKTLDPRLQKKLEINRE